MRPLSRRLVTSALAAGLFLLPLVSTAGPAWAARAHDSVSLNLVAYSTPKAAYDAIVPAFQKTSAGAGVSIQASYGASGDQSRQVAEGLPADIVNFSLEPDIGRLVKAGIVASSWYKNKYHGFVTNSIVVFVVRPGNPKHIHTWNDLIKPGIQVITPNPFTSGGARWNVMAAYGAQIAEGKKPAQAITYLTKLFANVVVQDDSARAELATFTGGKGDVMLSYENEAIGAQQAGQHLQYIIPPESILIENPIAVTKTTKHPKEATAFVRYLYSTAGQTIFGQKGYRPVVSSVAKKFHFKNPKKLFTIRNFGTWTAVQTKFFDPQNGIMAKIERGKGVSP